MLTVNDFITTRTGRYVYLLDDPKNYECVAIFWDFNRTMNRSEAYAADGAADLWNIPWKSYTKVLPADLTYGDACIWSGTAGEYQNDGNGHVALYTAPTTTTDTILGLSQNPNPAQIMPLSTDGLLGGLRMIPLNTDETFLRELGVNLP